MTSARQRRSAPQTAPRNDHLDPASATRSKRPNMSSLTCGNQRKARHEDPPEALPHDDPHALTQTGRNSGRYTDSVSQPLAEPPHLPPATEQQARTHAAQLIS